MESKEKCNEGCTEPADTLRWCFSSLRFFSKQPEESNSSWEYSTQGLFGEIK